MSMRDHWKLGAVALSCLAIGGAASAIANGFTTVTFVRGFVQSVNGQQLMMTEGTKRMTYKNVTLTIPTGARVRDNGAKSTLADLTPGQHVIVIVGPKQTFVRARTA